MADCGRFRILSEADYADLESKKDNTLKAYTMFKNLYVEFLETKFCVESGDVLQSKPPDFVYESVRKFVSSVRTKKGEHY